MIAFLKRDKAQIMWWRFPFNPTAYDDDFEDQPAQSWFHQWVLGIILSGSILFYGIWIVISRQAEFSGDSNQSMTLHGVNAIAYGVAVISAGVFLHCHYFWGNVYNQAWFAVLGKIISACGFSTGLIVLIIRVGIFGLG